MRTRSILVALLALAPFTTARAQQVNINQAVAKDVAVTFQGPFGRLNIIAWAHDSISITGTLMNGAQIENVFPGDPGVRPRGAKVYIRGPENMIKGGTTIEMRVPRAARVWVKGGISQVNVTGLTGEIDVSLVGGEVTVNANPRDVNIEAMDAKIMFEGAASRLHMKTAAGDIVARGRVLDASFYSVAGNIHVEASLERARFESSSGTLTYAGELSRGASVDFITHSGAVDLLLAGKPDVVIEAVTMQGSIENLFTSKSASARRDGRGQELELELAFGDGRIEIQSYKGNIRLGRMK